MWTRPDHFGASRAYNTSIVADLVPLACEVVWATILTTNTIKTWSPPSSGQTTGRAQSKSTQHSCLTLVAPCLPPGSHLTA
eukprot:scaffold76246_cov15-Prasinocladus_malaysianus.AAC.1